MRALNTQELNSISGGDAIYFELLPNVEIIGFERELIGFENIPVWTEHTGLFSTKVHEIEVPIYEYYPIYSQTVTYYS